MSKILTLFVSCLHGLVSMTGSNQEDISKNQSHTACLKVFYDILCQKLFEDQYIARSIKHQIQ